MDACVTEMAFSQTDSFVRERLPPREQWPQIIPLFGVDDSGPQNCVSWLLDAHLHGEQARRIAVRSGERAWSYEALGERVMRLARLMRERYGVAPGNRVLIRGANSPEAVLAWLAIQRIGAVAVTTMSLLRAAELRTMIEISQPALAICDEALAGELAIAIEGSGRALPVLHYGEDSGAMFAQMASVAADCETFPAMAEDVSIIGFTSGTTGKPKATVHFHRDMRAIVETVSKHILKPQADDVFIATAPLAFTFGLGGLLVFPLQAGACSVLHGRYTPADYVEAINRYRATVCFTVPTYYQQIMRLEHLQRLHSLRLAVSSGEALPLNVRELWFEKTGLHLTEVLGSTEMLHAFAGSTGAAIRPGFIGPAIPGYEIAVLDDEGRALPPGEIGRFAVRGPTGCRYMDDPRQKDYARFGWNLTGDACSMSGDVYVAYHTRYDDLIVSSGYNISGIEVENVLLEHDAVAECAVIGERDDERGMIVAAFVVLKDHSREGAAMAKALQDHVKNAIAPYKYPRRIEFIAALPRNESGKIQRFRLRG